MVSQSLAVVSLHTATTTIFILRSHQSDIYYPTCSVDKSTHLLNSLLYKFFKKYDAQRELNCQDAYWLWVSGYSSAGQGWLTNNCSWVHWWKFYNFPTDLFELIVLSSYLRISSLQLTYQERLREWPFEALTTCSGSAFARSGQGANSNSGSNTWGR